MSPSRASKTGIKRDRTPFEWFLLVTSLLAALALAVGLAVHGLTGPEGPADLRVDVAGPGQPSSGGQPFEVTVTNVGGASAENVIVEVSVGDVTREVDLDLVAKGDVESATVVMPDGASGTPHAEVVSYTNP